MLLYPLVRKGWTLCKGARAGHDRRSDVPTVGITTIDNLAAHGGGCLAVAAGDVIMIDRDEMLARADELGIAVVGVPHAQPGAQRAELDRGVFVVPSGASSPAHS